MKKNLKNTATDMENIFNRLIITFNTVDQRISKQRECNKNY